MDNYRILCDFTDELKALNTSNTNDISVIRKLTSDIIDIKSSLLNGEEISDIMMERLTDNVNNVVDGTDVKISYNIETTHELEIFQIGITEDNVKLDFEPNSTIPPEKGSIIQQLWKIRFKDNTTGYAIMSETSREDVSTLLNAQISKVLSEAPSGSVEDLNLTLDISTFNNNNRDLSDVLVGLEKPGLVARELRDINIDTDPALIDLDNDIKNRLKIAINDDPNNLNELNTLINEAGLYSTSLGPSPNIKYSDLKRLNIVVGDETHVVTINLPIISWGPEIAGIPTRSLNGDKVKTNRKSDGTSYIVDMGGMDPVIRQGFPNPLPATKFYNNGPNGSTETEGALDRYGGGKCLGLNTTSDIVIIKTTLLESDGMVDLEIPPMSTIWKLDRSTFDGGNKHAYYTVYSASRAPPAGFMGVVLAPKQNRLGRGRGEDASGVTLANGVSETGKTFNVQDENGPILTNNEEVPANLKGVTCSFDGHGMDAKDLLKFLQQHNFVRGEHYLTIPSNGTLETVEDILIPEGQFIPQISQAVGTLIQFGNGKYIRNGGPNRFQSGLIPFLPGTPAYTPEWQINFLYYNCGNISCDGDSYDISNVTKQNTPENWHKPKQNASYGTPGPNPNNTQESGYNPIYPDTFDPVQLRCGIKRAQCVDYINECGGYDGEINIHQLPKLEKDNKIFLTEAPGGANRGWVKFLVVNCPLPVVATINVTGSNTNNNNNNTNSSNNGSNNNNNPTCKTCKCDRSSDNISINGDFNPIWLEEEASIGTRMLKLKVGDNIIVKSTAGTQHGVSIRMDNMESATSFDKTKTLEQLQTEVLNEIKSYLTINNVSDIDHNVIALADDVINFHGGIPITFTERSVVNPQQNPDGLLIANITVKEGTENMSGTVSCTVHGVSMSFRFTICP